MSKGATVSVFYPAQEGAKFDIDYYLATHMALVWKTWKPYGLINYKVTKFGPGSTYAWGCTMEWENIEGFQKAGEAPGAKEVFNDIENFSNVQPVIVAGEVVGTN
ncbi:hypothetical protein P280DRAFT_510746 [Massarina eburnea CBS 473.64]|uniref:EthD domain-containing protein n=1 Tax=Massarina eburnea CBS 473.64 TaxID=1395130 RepID=A0A6A6RLR7_9PLEO|nr:hypothetical protein P280DRAFT_510746 [Massarina eburnea CBS 473.64]